MPSHKKPIVLICDMQTRFQSIIHEFSRIEARICALIDICREISIPILLTTQTKAKLGDTVPRILTNLDQNVRSFDKTLFSMTTDPLMEILEEEKRTEIVLVGIEAHICVLQTAQNLQARGFAVTVLADAISSSSLWECQVALRRLEVIGAKVVSLESWTFEVMEDAKNTRFPTVSSILKRSKLKQLEFGKPSL